MIDSDTSTQQSLPTLDTHLGGSAGLEGLSSNNLLAQLGSLRLDLHEAPLISCSVDTLGRILVTNLILHILTRSISQNHVRRNIDAV